MHPRRGTHHLVQVSTPEQAYDFGRQQLAAKHTEEALAVFHANAVHHPELWFVHDGMARAYSAQGKFSEADKEMRAAIASAPAGQKSTLEALLKRLESKQDINQ
jgi:Tfp pilus assembly protein PilF